MEMGMPTTIFESNILDDEAIYEIIGRFCFNGKFVKNECTIEENGPDYDFMLDDTRSKINHNAEHMIPPRQNIFDKSKKNVCISPKKRRRTNRSQKSQPSQGLLRRVVNS